MTKVMIFKRNRNFRSEKHPDGERNDKPPQRTRFTRIKKSFLFIQIHYLQNLIHHALKIHASAQFIKHRILVTLTSLKPQHSSIFPDSELFSC